MSRERMILRKFCFGFVYSLSLAWIISAKRILSAIFEYTAGDDLISSGFNRTAAISEAAMSSTEFGLLPRLLLLGMLLLRFRLQLAPGLGGPLKTSFGP